MLMTRIMIVPTKSGWRRCEYNPVTAVFECGDRCDESRVCITATNVLALVASATNQASGYCWSSCVSYCPQLLWGGTVDYAAA